MLISKMSEEKEGFKKPRKAEKRHEFGQPFHTEFIAIKNSQVVETMNGCTNGYVLQYSSSVSSNDIWLRHGRHDNNPNIKLQYYKDIALNRRAIETKGDMVFGSGLEYIPIDSYFQKDERTNDFVKKTIALSDAEKVRQIEKAEIVAHRISLLNAHRKASYLMPLHSETAFVVRHDKDINGNGRIMDIDPILNQKFRIGDSQDFFSNIPKYQYVSNKFGILDSRGNPVVNAGNSKPVSLKNYNKRVSTNKTKAGYSENFVGQIHNYKHPNSNRKQGTQLLHVPILKPFREHYGTADYESSEYIKYSQIGYELATFDLADLQNGLGLTHIITIFRDQKETIEEERKLRTTERKIWQNKLRGTHNQGKFILDRVAPSTDDSGKPNAQTGISITTLEDNNNDGRHKILRENKNIALLGAHGIIDPKSIGVPNMSSNGLSGQVDFLITAIEMMEHTSVGKYVETLEDTYSKILQSEGCFVKVRRKKTMPLYQKLTDVMMNTILLDDEKRAHFGYDALNDEQKILLKEEVASKLNSRNNQNNKTDE